MHCKSQGLLTSPNFRKHWHQEPLKAVAGAATQSVADQEAIKALFPNTYGMPLITFEAGEAVTLPAMNVGVILSGGQAPGGHNVISGLFDGIKKLNPDNKLYGFIFRSWWSGRPQLYGIDC